MEWTGGHGRDGAQHDRDETREKPPHKQAGTRVSCVPRGVRRFEVDWSVGVGTVWCEQRRAAAKGKRHVLAPLALRLRRRDGLGIPISVRRTTRRAAIYASLYRIGIYMRSLWVVAPSRGPRSARRSRVLRRRRGVGPPLLRPPASALAASVARCRPPVSDSVLSLAAKRPAIE